MSVKYEFVAKLRTQRGKAVSRRQRRDEDLVPAVVYGAGQDPQSIMMPHNDVFHALKNEAVFSHILKLTIDGKAEQVVIKDVQRHVYRPKILHLDFLRIKATEKLTMNVPLHFIGEEEEVPGIKAGGKFTKNITDLEIRCLPADLPEFIAVDISKMELDDVLHLSDIQLPHGVELAHAIEDEEHNHPVIACHIPRVAQEDIEAEQQEALHAEEASADSTETPAVKTEEKPEAPEEKDEE